MDSGGALPQAVISATATIPAKTDGIDSDRATNRLGLRIV